MSGGTPPTYYWLVTKFQDASGNTESPDMMVLFEDEEEAREVYEEKRQVLMAEIEEDDGLTSQKEMLN
tara:strand:- start:440 stop:643 length:204 start_codon:yes stop_codon:yes gene_type:complete